MTMSDVPWIAEAKRHIGVAEIPGAQTSGAIAGWLHALRAWWNDDETPWCGVFVAYVFRILGIAIPKHWMRARAWLDWGEPLPAPQYGCVVIFERPGGGGHVGFVVGLTPKGRVMVLGGNQGNRVSIAPFNPARALGYRMPPGAPLGRIPMPIIAADDEVLSSNES